MYIKHLSIIYIQTMKERFLKKMEEILVMQMKI